MKIKKFFLLLILITAPILVFAETRERQLVTGVGKKVNEALQNAAEIALMNSVGTFIDTETLISKRTEIRDGVRKQSKSYNNEMLESSKGTIEQIDILETRNENGLVYIDAVIVVRVDDLKVLIEPIVKAEKKISKGLFAKVQKTKSQNADKEQLLLKRVFYPIISGDNTQIEILGIDSVDDITDYRPQYLKNFLSRFKDSFSEKLYQNFPRYLKHHETKYLSDSHKRQLKDYESGYVVTIKIELKDDLVNQMKEILDQVSYDKVAFPHDNLARDRKTLSNICQGTQGHCNSDINTRPICYNDKENTNCYVVNLGKPKKRTEGKMVLENLLNETNPYDHLKPFKNNYKVILYDTNDKEIFNDYIKFSKDSVFGRYNVLSMYHNHYNLKPRIYGSAHHYYQDYTIYKESYDQIFLTLPDEILSNADRIEIKSEKSREFVNQTKKRPFLGVFLNDINDEIANETGWTENSGSLITKIAQGGAAERFNLQSGDIILSINDIKIVNTQDLVKRIATFTIGEKFEIVIWRNKQKLKKIVIMGEK